MNHICLHAYGKINLALDVLGKRADGYHDLKMIMHSISLHDVLFIKKSSSRKIEIKCDNRRLPTDERNLVYRAAQLLIDRCNIDSGVFMELTKGIPIAAGLGGGSADCAAALIGMRALFDLPITDTEMQQIGKSLGADVPFCLTGGTALAEGIGEVLTPLPMHPPAIFVLARPRFQISTSMVYNGFDPARVSARPDVDGMVAALHRQDLRAVTARYSNVLETVTEPMRPIITDIKAHMLAHGAHGTLMSGSGPTVFACFDDRAMAVKAMKALKRTENLYSCEVRLCQTQKIGIDIT